MATSNQLEMMEFMATQDVAVNKFRFEKEMESGRIIDDSEAYLLWCQSDSAKEFRDKYNQHYAEFENYCENHCHHKCEGMKKCSIPPPTIADIFGEPEPEDKWLDYSFE